MMIHVRFFAALREAVGRDSLDVSFDGGDLTDLLATMQVLLDEAGFDALRAPSVRVAVNREFVQGNCVVRNGDEVAFMPPITGG